MAPSDVLAKAVEVRKHAGPIDPEVIEVISDVRKVRARDHDLLHSTEAVDRLAWQQSGRLP